MCFVDFVYCLGWYLRLDLVIVVYDYLRGACCFYVCLFWWINSFVIWFGYCVLNLCCFGGLYLVGFGFVLNYLLD